MIVVKIKAVEKNGLPLLLWQGGEAPPRLRRPWSLILSVYSPCCVRIGCHGRSSPLPLVTKPFEIRNPRTKPPIVVVFDVYWRLQASSGFWYESRQLRNRICPVLVAGGGGGAQRLTRIVYSRCCIRICSAMVGVPPRPRLPSLRTPGCTSSSTSSYPSPQEKESLLNLPGWTVN